MKDAQSADLSAARRIGKQIVLPWSKAIEIAAKSIKVRFWRSMITMSSIVLAIAFLMSIWTSTGITAALAIGPQRSIHAPEAPGGERRELGVVHPRISLVRSGLCPARPELRRGRIGFVPGRCLGRDGRARAQWAALRLVAAGQ